MNLQSRTITRYRQLYPADTLREISSRTGIQITRVHRILNGHKAMKVGELEAFESCIQSRMTTSPDLNRLSSAINQASAIMTTEEIVTLAEYIERKNTARKYGRLYAGKNFESAIIA